MSASKPLLIKYSRIALSSSDEEDDQAHILFERESENSGTFGKSRKVGIKLRTKKHRPSSCCGRLCAAAAVLAVLSSLIVLVYLLSKLDITKLAVALAFLKDVSKQTTPSGVQFSADQISNQSDWTVQFPLTGSESPLRTVHVNGDTTLDLIFGVSLSEPIKGNQSCSDNCNGAIIAIDGNNGQTLWTIPTKDEVYEMRCPAYDADKDGVYDCVASGRYGTLIVFHPQTGKVIWDMPGDLNRRWNAFAGGLIHDVDGDEVEELIVTNGGDTTFLPEEHERPGNELVVLSGSTGKLIGRKLATPDGKESYSLPSVYTFSDGSQYIFFGTGGETVSGGLYMMSLKSLVEYILPGENVPLPGHYNHWIDSQASSDSSGIVNLYRCKQKGVILPISIVDINSDGTDDIVSVTHDGLLLVFSGVDLSFVWNPRNFTVNTTSTETYTMPGFGYFNDDDKLDIMIAWQTGEYPMYDTQLIFIVSGADGEVLWYKQTPSNTYTSTAIIALRTAEKFRDAFIFTMSSINQKFSGDITDVQGGLRKRREKNSFDTRRRRRHIGMHDKVEANSCDHMEPYTMDWLIIDRTTMKSAVRIYQQIAEPYHYNLTNSMRTHGKIMQMIHQMKHQNAHDGRKKRHGDDDDEESNFDDGDGNDADHVIPMCARMTPRDASPPVIADIDNDGLLDLVIMDTAFAKVVLNEDGNVTQPVLHSTIRKYSLEKILPFMNQVELDEVHFAPIVIPSDTKLLTEVSIAPYDKQKWPQLLGRKQNGVY